MDVEERRARIRQKMRDGELPRRSTTQLSVVAGPGEGLPCSICGRTIRASETEFEFGSGVRIDARCFELWLDEARGEG